MSEKIPSDLLPCPFCGAPAKVFVVKPNFIIVGCANKENIMASMLCPTPRITVYKYPDGRGWNYEFWNRRVDVKKPE